MKNARLITCTLLLSAAIVGIGATALAEGVGQVLVRKSIPAATIALIDPESGTSAGGAANTDINIAIGDVILFQFDFAGVPDKSFRGLQAYLTEYIPTNTQVVGVRMIDHKGLTIRPRWPGLAQDSCMVQCNTDPFYDLPCNDGGGACVSNARDIEPGSIAQVYADTGIFYSTDSRTAREPDNAFLNLANGINMSLPAPNGRVPNYVTQIDTLIGLSNGDDYFAHNFWDVVQVVAFGWKNNATSGNSGKNNTPYLYGSPVAGPQTYYKYEATETSANPLLETTYFNDAVGPWNRIRYPGSKIGTGAAVYVSAGPLSRMGTDPSLPMRGLDLRPNDAVPVTANALRYAMGEATVGEVRAAEVALRVLDTPLDGNQSADVNCAEVFGGDVSGSSTGSAAEDNAWGLFVPSPNCVFLNLLFELDVNKPVADGSDVLTYTLRGKNLSTLPQDNVDIVARFTGSEFGFEGADNGGAEASCPAGAGGTGDTCIVWAQRDLAPGEEYTFTFQLSVGGIGSAANVVMANYRSDNIASPGFTTQALTIVKPVAVVEATMGPSVASANAGDAVTFTGQLRNFGNAIANLQQFNLTLPSGWTMAATPTFSEGSVSCNGVCTGSTAKYTFSGATLDPLADCNDGIDNAEGSPDEDTDVDAADSGCISALDQSEQASNNGEIAEPWITFSFAVNVSGGASTDLHAIQLQLLHSQSGVGLNPETFLTSIRSAMPGCSDGLDNDRDGSIDFPDDPGCSSALDDDEDTPLRYLPEFGVLPVGQLRTPRPVLNCPGNNQSSVSGNLGAGTDFDPTATVTLYFNGIPRAADTTSTTDFTVSTSIGGGGGFATRPACSDGSGSDFPGNANCASPYDDDDTTGAVTVSPFFGPLYGGLEVRASATGDGQLESELSEPCTVAVIPTCADGIDNDGDSLTDFPADPGCDSPRDGSEEDGTPECSDGIDNDASGGGEFDYPDDPGCKSADDNSETGVAECDDGIDNDNDGRIDDGDDPGCDDINDVDEQEYPACMNTLDDDGLVDGIDFPDDLQCHSSFDDDEGSLGYTTGDPSPRLLLLFDTSGSMNFSTCNAEFTGGDGSLECPGNEVYSDADDCPDPDNCVVCPAGSTAGNGEADDSRLDTVKRGITQVVGAFGEVDFGLMRFFQRPTEFACPSENASLRSGGWQGAGAAPCGGGFDQGELLVGFTPENVPDLLTWMDGQSNYDSTAALPQDGYPPPRFDQELRGSGTTPIAGALTTADDYLSALRAADTLTSFEGDKCRPYRVVLITDGAETCGGDPEAVATAICDDDGFGNCQGFPVNVIGFATSDTAITDSLDDIALAGGTGSAIFADDETSLSLAMASIIAETIRTELCNGIDDDCDGAVDEGFSIGAACDNGALGACFGDGTLICADLTSTICDYDPEPGTSSEEVCNDADDDCDGKVDEQLSCIGCIPAPEICNGVDDDCDDLVDNDDTDDLPLPGVGQTCGFTEGECLAGTLECIDGDLECSGTGPAAEICDGNDNDCDGFTDGFETVCFGDGGTAETWTSAGGDWSALSPDPSPGPRYHSSASYDIATTSVVLFAGQGAGGFLLDTWEWDGADWSDVTPVVSPPARDHHATAYDAANQRVVLFGGQGTSGFLGDTWLWNGTSWAQITPASSPPARYGHAMAYDANRGRVVLFGGYGAGGVRADTWEWDGNTWAQITPAAAPPARADHAMAYDDARMRVVLFGGSDASGRRDDTWTYDGSTWSNPAPATRPSARFGHAMTDDSDRDRVVLFGGDAGARRDDTWEWNGTTWASVATTTQPPARSAHVLAFDPVAGLSVLFGGTESFTQGCTIGGGCLGVCRLGIRSCPPDGPGTWGDCAGDLGPSGELCNGIDDDCDGSVDEDWPSLDDGCSNGSGLCMTTGVIACTANGAGIFCTAPVVEVGTEICNGFDDDCDDKVDEGTLPPPVGDSCGGGSSCEAGVLTCIDGDVVCTAATGAAEICDNKDNDCDSFIDEDVSEGTGEDCVDEGFEEIEDTGECEFGETVCVVGEIVCRGYKPPQDEICDGKDNDCDGETDEGVTADQAVDCPSESSICFDGECLRPCSLEEFGCGFGAYCAELPVGNFCVDDPCVDLSCESREVCDREEGACVDACGEVNCLSEQRCVQGICTDCFQIRCGGGQLCVANDEGVGVCQEDACAAADCADDEFCVDGKCSAIECDAQCVEGEECILGECTESACADVLCRVGTLCDRATGECVEDVCASVAACPQGQACIPREGRCESDPCQVSVCPAGTLCRLMFDGTPHCVDPASSGPIVVSNTVDADGNPIIPDGKPRTVIATGGGGSKCSLASSPGSSGAPGSRGSAQWLWALAAAVTLWRRRTPRGPRAGR